LAELIERKPAIEQPRTIRTLDRPRRLVVAVALGQFAEHRVEYVIESEQPDHRAIFVEHHGGMRGRLLEDLQDLRPASSLVDESGKGEKPLDPERRSARVLCQQVLDLDDPQQVVKALIADRKPRVRRADDLATDLVG